MVENEQIYPPKEYTSEDMEYYVELCGRFGTPYFQWLVDEAKQTLVDGQSCS